LEIAGSFRLRWKTPAFQSVEGRSSFPDNPLGGLAESLGIQGMDCAKRDVLLDDTHPVGGSKVSNRLSRINPDNPKTPDTAIGPDQLIYAWIPHAQITSWFEPRTLQV
jgi:hypothetical protein